MNYNMDVLDRIKQIISTNELSVSAFAKSIGLAQVTVNNYILGKRKISFELIDAIAKNYPNISLEWLLRGDGEMYVSDKPQQPSSVGEEYYKQMVKEMEAMKDRLDNLEGKVS